MKSISFIIISNLFFVFSPVIGQNTLDQGYTPPKSSILGSENPGNTSGGDYINELNTNNVRLNLVSLFRSNLLFTYERAITSDFSLIGGIGIPFGIDGIQLGSYENFGGEDFAFDDDNYENEIKYYNLISNSNFKSGFLGSFGLRFYFNDNFYYEAGFRHSIRNLVWKHPAELIIARGNNFHVTNEPNKTAVTNYFMNIGSQWSGGNGKFKFNHEISFGMGLNVVKYPIYSIVNPQNSTYGSIGTLVNTKEIIRDYNPSFNLTYCIGIGW